MHLAKIKKEKKSEILLHCKTTYGDDVRSRDDEQLLKRTCQEGPTKEEIKDGNTLFKLVYCPKPINYMVS